MDQRPASDGPHVPVVYLETERLVLRRFTADDLDDLVALDGDPAVMRYITGGPPTPRDEMRDDYLPAWLAYYDRGDRYGFWAAIERETGAFLGWFHLRPLPEDPDDEPELGYRLIRAAWGRGYATEGSIALVDKAFAELGARRVHASTMAVNLGSRRVMEKSGMRFVRTFVMDWPVRIEGDEEGDVEYAIDRAQWEADRARPADPARAPAATPARNRLPSRTLDDGTRPGLDERVALGRRADLQDQRTREHERRADTWTGARASCSSSAASITPATGSNSIRIPVLEPPIWRIAVRNSSDESPAAAIPASSRTGHGDSVRNGATSLSALPGDDREHRAADHRPAHDHRVAARSARSGSRCG